MMIEGSVLNSRSTKWIPSNPLKQMSLQQNWKMGLNRVLGAKILGWEALRHRRKAAAALRGRGQMSFFEFSKRRRLDGGGTGAGAPPVPLEEAQDVSLKKRLKKIHLLKKILLSEGPPAPREETFEKEAGVSQKNSLLSSLLSSRRGGPPRRQRKTIGPRNQRNRAHSFRLRLIKLLGRAHSAAHARGRRSLWKKFFRHNLFEKHTPPRAKLPGSFLTKLKNPLHQSPMMRQYGRLLEDML